MIFDTHCHLYDDPFTDLEDVIKRKAKKILQKEPEKVSTMKTDLEKMKELARTTKKTSRALFSDDTAKNVLSHKSKYKVEE